MKRRREFITIIGGVALLPLAAPTQQAVMPFIGLLAAGTVPNWQFRSIQKGLNEGGCIEGRNLAIMCRSAGGEWTLCRIAEIAN